jgi:SAM-dependent methyltransferase
MTERRITRTELLKLVAIIGLLIAALVLLNINMGSSDISSVAVAVGAVIFWCLPAVVWSQRERLLAVRDSIARVADEETWTPSAHRLLSLFLISFVVLFVETMLIRYIGSQTRIFAFYKNIPLIGAFLGLGIGCFAGAGGRREALMFLAGITVVALFFAVAAQGLGAFLGLSASLASSERVFGYGVTPEGFHSIALELLSHIHMGLFCSAVFLGLAALFGPLGRILGASFEGLGRIQAYSVNILGSLAGLIAFVGLSALQTSPWVWFLVGLLPMLWWLGKGRARQLGMACIALATLFVAPTLNHTVWSAYQKLVGQEIPHGYTIDISDTFYQAAFDLRPETIAQLGTNPLPHYSFEFAGRPNLDNVLVVGAGSGNDVATALRAGAKHVDAVDIDRAIVQMGRDHHPERPYDNPRVRVIIDDARHAFKTLPPSSYDEVLFGQLDSHTALGASSVRLDNYVFTQESFSDAARLVRPGGVIVLSIVTGVDWMRTRYARMLEHACGAPVEHIEFETSSMYICHPTTPDPDPTASGIAVGAPVDDWPFPYLPDRSIPLSYLIVIAMLVGASLLWLRRNGIGMVDATPAHAHMFFLGAAFLLMEVYAINRLALLFGTTWLVSAVSIAVMLVEIVVANLVVGLVKRDIRPYAYVALFALLLGGWAVGPDIVLGKSLAAAFGYALFLLSPVFCAGIVFANSFRRSPNAGTALGANILGAVLGAWSEYLTMATGIRFMALLALALYAASLLSLIIAQRKSGRDAAVPSTS